MIRTGRASQLIACPRGAGFKHMLRALDTVTGYPVHPTRPGRHKVLSRGGCMQIPDGAALDGRTAHAGVFATRTRSDHSHGACGHWL